MAFLRHLGTNLILLLAIAADLITVGILLRKPIGLTPNDGSLIIYYSNLLIGTLTVILFIRVTYYEVWWRRKKRYALAFSIINQGFAEVHELERIEAPETVTKLNSLEKFCDALTQTFQHITSSQCSVCIKVLSIPGGK